LFTGLINRLWRAEWLDKLRETIAPDKIMECKAKLVFQ
jgi:hypothetical protein